MATELMQRHTGAQQGPINTNRTVQNPKKRLSQARKQTFSERRFHSFKNLQFEFFRLATFAAGWENKNVSPPDLARNGFFFMHRQDYVQCNYCRGVIAAWEEGDDPATEHRKHYPNCPFVQGSQVSNVPMNSTNISTYLEGYITRKLDDEIPPKPKRLYQTDSASVHPGPQQSDSYPDYSSVQKRQDTYKDPPINVPCREKMANAGFFLLGLSDMSQCYSCGGGVFNWNRDEDPLLVHAELYPECRLVKELPEPGQQVRKGIKRSSPEPIDNDEMMMEFPLAKKLMAVGWDSETVSAALTRQIEEYGILPCNLSDAMDLVADYEDMAQ